MFTRSSRVEVFWKINVLKYFAKFTGKRLCCSLFNFIQLDSDLTGVFFFLFFWCEFCEIFNNIFFYIILSVAGSGFPITLDLSTFTET